MTVLPFSTELVQFLFDHRSDGLLQTAKFASLFGEVEGYVVVVALIYVSFDKRLAFRLAVVALLAMTFNHFLKTLIGNPRPFVADGSFTEKWAVSHENMTELASEFSTPSGHAMSASAFYCYLMLSVRNRPLRVAAILVVLCTGLSRPYLGVHFLEDILLGWAVGLAFAIFAFRYGPAFGNRWARLSPAAQPVTVVILSVAIYLVTLWANDGATDRQPLLFVEYLGFLTGIVAAHPLERYFVNFEPRSGSTIQKAGRCLITILLIMLPILAYDSFAHLLVPIDSSFGHGIRYAAYSVAGLMGMFVAPFVLTRLRLVEQPSGRDD